ncbi:DNA helicase RecQ [Pontibacter russatus]|uniref:DNA helicase RecQ n=1 Tax=Pontibacter russatus TaxID=2694929 RepID=UPI00137AEECD|nr:DNA helicase RecQ [Pontibacter russatus]
MATMREAREALKLYFGYEQFRPMQEQIISGLLQQKDAVVLMPTGGGKSVCYQVPAVVLPGICVVVSPLIALMKDQVEALLANGIPAAYINSSQSAEQQYAIENECLEGKLKLLYVSPEKLLSSGFLSFLGRVRVSLFAVDEAHCISSWGHDFRPEYTQLKALKHHFPQIPVVALTATADKLTQKDIQEQLHLQSPEVYIASFDRPNINLTVKPGRDRFNKITDFISSRPRQPGIIYCLSRKATESLANKLKQNGFNATFYHAGMSAPLRAKAQEAFLKDDVQMVCATVAFGMGIDKSNVRWVIHYNLPKNIEGYYQEIGRAGRDGAKADALLFYSFADVMNMRSMLQENESDKKQTELQLVKLERMQQFAEAAACRRRILLQYFGETMQKDCGNCDICRNPPTTFDGTQLVQKALSAIARTQEQATMTLLVDVLRGARNSQVLQSGFDKIKTYGAGRDVSTLDWNRYLHQMLNSGLVEIAYDQGYTLKLTEQSREVLFEGRRVQLVKFEEVRQPEEATVRARPKRELIKDALFERLRALRKRLADEAGVPPYVVFTDSSLQEMAAERPTNRIAMLAISGVGAQKLERFGDTFITEIIDFINEEQAKGSKLKGATHLATYEMLQQGYGIEQIARQRSLNPVTIYSHLATLYEQGYDIDLHQFVTKAEYKAIAVAIQKLGTEAKLKDLFEALGEQYEYYKIRLAVSIYKKGDTW